MSDHKLTTNADDLAPQIIREHIAAQDHHKQAIEHAIAAGELLIEAKGKVAHGKWLDWVTENCHFSERKAQAYMQLAEHKEAIRSSAADSIRNALEAIAKPQRLAPPPVVDAEAEEEFEEPQSDDPEPPDLAPDEKAVRWADETMRRIEEDIKFEDLDLWLSLKALAKLLSGKLEQDPGLAEASAAQMKAGPAPAETESPPKKKKGRKKGSRNRPKPTETPERDAGTAHLDPGESAKAMGAQHAASDEQRPIV